MGRAASWPLRRPQQDLEATRAKIMLTVISVACAKPQSQSTWRLRPHLVVIVASLACAARTARPPGTSGLTSLSSLAWPIVRPHGWCHLTPSHDHLFLCCLQVIKRFIMHAKKTAFVVEHDFIMAAYLADRVIVYEGEPSRDATARCPQSLLSGMNLFLKNLDITFRRDPTNYRPRINKMESTKDREQKLAGTYYYLEQ